MAQNPDLVNTKNKISFRPLDVFNTLYNVQLSDKYENLLKGVWCNDAYLIIDLEDQYMVN